MATSRSVAVVLQTRQFAEESVFVGSGGRYGPPYLQSAVGLQTFSRNLCRGRAVFSGCYNTDLHDRPTSSHIKLGLMQVRAAWLECPSGGCLQFVNERAIRQAMLGLLAARCEAACWLPVLSLLVEHTGRLTNTFKSLSSELSNSPSTQPSTLLMWPAPLNECIDRPFVVVRAIDP